MDEKTARIEAAKNAVMTQVDFFHEKLGRVPSSWKADGTRVTPVDIAISEHIFERLQCQFPEDDFCSEEVVPNAGEMPLPARFTWLLDPVDGTNNYALGIPYCAISLALLENGVPVYGVIYDMARRHLMFGGKDLGVFDDAMGKSLKDNELEPNGLIAIHRPLEPR